MLGKGFKSSKCKTSLKLAMSRIKLLRNKRDIQVKQMRHDISQLLGTGQEASARIRVEHVIREQNILDAYDMIELFAELVVVRLPIIEGQKTCPADLKEAVASLIFAAPRCADLPELADIKSCFVLKYGKEFVAAAAELRPSCGVSRRIIEKMSVRAPAGETKLKVLKEIAAEYNATWDPANSEAELLKQPEDLLAGPQQFVAASTLPHAGPAKPDSSPRTVKKVPAAQATPSPLSQGTRTKPVLSKHSTMPSSRKECRNGSAPAYKDVAAAAQAAAESAEHAAAAARAVANLATREILQGLSDQAINTVPHGSPGKGISPRHKLKDYLSGYVDDVDSSMANKFHFDEHRSARSSRDELFRNSSGSPGSGAGSDDYDDLTARFQALKARRYS